MMTKKSPSSFLPNAKSAIIFFLYIALFVNQGILVTASKEKNNSYKYNTVVAVLLQEVLKLVACTGLYCSKNSFVSIFTETRKNLKVLGLYFIPSALYCFYNNLTFVNLASFDPTTYFILLQFRVVLTGIIFQCVFKKHLTCLQWFSLIVLTTGCMIKYASFGIEHKGTGPSIIFQFSTVFIIVQMLCSCFAGVYNEYLLKQNSQDLNIFIQNIFMYVDSILCNLLALVYQGDFLSLFSVATFEPFNNLTVMLVILNNASVGIVTSFFLQSLNSILKTFASGLELVFTAALSYLLFSIPVTWSTCLSIGLIISATVLYSRNPVNNARTTTAEKTTEGV